MNSLDGYIKEESDMPSINKKSKRWKKIDKLKKDFKQDFPEDMTEKDFKKLIQNFESFAKAWDKEYTKSNLKDTAKETTMEEWEQELKLDRELTPQEKFELYYDERERRINKGRDKGYTLNQMCKKLGISRSKK